MIVPSRLPAAHAGLGILAAAFVLAHMPALPSSLEDIDSVNFALGVRDFDVSRHRPHPPGYPLYIAAAKTAVAAAGLVAPAPDDAHRSRVEARAMAVLSLVGAVVASVCLYRVFACLSRAGADRLRPPWRAFDARAMAATALAVACPLYWYMAVRPMSDAAGLAAALAAIVCLALAWWRQQSAPDGDRRLDPAHMRASGRMIVLGSLLAAVSIGFRSQNAMLTVPFLLAVLLDRIGRGVAGAMLGGGVAFVAGTLFWGVPLLVASGGLGAYLAALGQQAGEDFAGVEMLYLNPSPRLAANALVSTLVYPWDSVLLGSVVLVLAACGLVALLLHDRRSLAAVIALSVPYLVFHLLFHDVDFVRYALPVIPAVAFLAVRGLDLVVRRAALPASGALALWSVAIAAPVLVDYGREPSPVVRALDAIRAELPSGEGVTLAMHQTFQRPLEAELVPVRERLPAPPRREWLELVRYWRDGHTAPIWFLADPRRTDLLLIDPRSRADRHDFGWRFTSLSQIGGMRPAALHWYRMSPPGWFAEEGWALTPETAGIARAAGRGPHLGPITAWVRRRAGAAEILIGGRHLGSAGDGPVRFSMTIAGKDAASWEAAPGFFLRQITIPAGVLAGSGLAPLEITSGRPGARGPETAIEQFDLQDAGSLMWAYADGWHEAEYNPRLGMWRWTSDRSLLRVVNAAHGVRVRLRIESPLRYFDAAPIVRLAAAGQVFAEARPDSDAVLDAVVPPEALRASDGLVAIETDRVFVPAERDGSPDRRPLGLRVFGVSVVDPN